MSKKIEFYSFGLERGNTDLRISFSNLAINGLFSRKKQRLDKWLNLLRAAVLATFGEKVSIGSHGKDPAFKFENISKDTASKLTQQFHDIAQKTKSVADFTKLDQPKSSGGRFVNAHIILQ